MCIKNHVNDSQFFLLAAAITKVNLAVLTWRASRAACARTTVRTTSCAQMPATTTIFGRTALNWSGRFVTGSARRTRKRAANDGSSAVPRAIARTRSTIITGSERSSTRLLHPFLRTGWSIVVTLLRREKVDESYTRYEIIFKLFHPAG